MASSLLLHPDEFWAMCKFKFFGGQTAIMPKNDTKNLPKSMRRCYQLLEDTSRSFAAVIQALDGDLRPAICIFYLVLRGLDTIEDDMTILHDIKEPLLRNFHKCIYEKGWNYNGNGPEEKDRHLLVEFEVVVEEFLNLKSEFQVVIADITRQMGNGMAKYLTAQVVSKEDYAEYCHYVAGLVGIGLSKLFSASGLEDEKIGKEEYLANSMGLFLQKTNIIRDYLEDIIEGRIFWPKDIWGRYAPTGKLEDFRSASNRSQALSCLNDLVTDALSHVPDVFDYLSQIRNQSVFNFCAIPQVMAISTLALIYDNSDVFTKTGVKIRKGLAVKLMMAATNMGNIFDLFHYFASSIESRIRKEDPSANLTQELTTKIKGMCESRKADMIATGALSSQGLHAQGLIIIAVLFASYFFTVRSAINSS